MSPYTDLRTHRDKKLAAILKNVSLFSTPFTVDWTRKMERNFPLDIRTGGDRDRQTEKHGDRKIWPFCEAMVGRLKL